MKRSFIHKKKLLFTLRDSELCIQPNKRTGLYNSAPLCISLWNNWVYLTLREMCTYTSHLPLLLVLDLVQSTDYGINWLFSSLGCTRLCAFIAVATVGVAELCLRADSIARSMSEMASDAWDYFPFSDVFHQPSTSAPYFPWVLFL